MNPMIFCWLVYAIWLAVVVYLTVAAFGPKAMCFLRHCRA
jgi:hypothetical protein